MRITNSQPVNFIHWFFLCALARAFTYPVKKELVSGFGGRFIFGGYNG